MRAAAFALVLVHGFPARGQDPVGPVAPATPEPQDPPPLLQDPAIDPSVQRLENRIVREVRVDRVEGQRLVPAPEALRESVLRNLTTRAGQPLQVARVTADLNALWNERRVVASFLAQEDGDQVVVRIALLREDRTYERIKFSGLKQLAEGEARELLGIDADRRVTSSEAVAMRNVLLARYRRDGYPFASVALREGGADGAETEEVARPELTFTVDEGEKVTVREFRFRGNASFPAWPNLGILGSDEYLTRDSKIASDPRWGLIRGEAFSREILEEDLDKLRLFYRGQGFLDAVVELAEVRFLPGNREVDLDIVVVEGPRYRIRSVKVLHVDANGTELPVALVRYPASEFESELRIVPGSHYDQQAIRRAMRAIQDFYGKRGHPARGFYSVQVQDSFYVLGRWPLESYVEGEQVDLTFRIVEGTPKDLRDVVIRGNDSTRDKVIRRKVYVLPGERIDMTKVDRSLRYLEQTRFFQDPVTLAGPQFELLPVPGRTDQLDLAIDVTEGETGELRWGVGISTGSGASLTFQFTKRNFDLWNPPTAWDPVTVFEELVGNKAFHGGGQTLDLMLAPGTEVSQAQIGFTEPDLFGQHFDTIELRVNGKKRIRRFRGYTTDTLGADFGLSRNFSEELSSGVSFREETTDVYDIRADAPLIVYESEGQTELRGPRLSSRYRDLDNLRLPSSGIDLNGSFEVLGGPFGAEVDVAKLVLAMNAYAPLFENARGQRHVLHFESSFGLAHAYDDSDQVYLTERFYLGGANLRGFDFRGAGPSQFGQPVGGEALFTTSLEYIVPLVTTRLEREVRDREIVRGLLFTDFGLLGLGIDDPSFDEPRLSVGFGVRIELPVLEIPIAIDLGWPVLYEESDDRQVLWFTLSR